MDSLVLREAWSLLRVTRRGSLSLPGSRCPICQVAVGCSRVARTGQPPPAGLCTGPSLCVIYRDTAVLGGVPGAAVTPSPWRGAGGSEWFQQPAHGWLVGG